LGLLKTINYFFKRSFLLNLSSAVQMLVYFVFNLYLLNKLNMEDFGVYKYFMTFIPFLNIFSFPSYNVAIKRDISKGKYGLFWKSFRLRIYFSFISIIGLFFLGLYFWYSGKILITYLSIISIIFFIPWYSFTFFRSFFLGRQEFKKVSIIQMISDLTFLLLLFLFSVFFKELDLIKIFLIQSISYSFFNLIFLYKAVKSFPSGKLENGDSIKVGKKLGISNLILMGASNIDNIILKFFVSFTDVAIYSGVTVIISIFKAMNKNFNTVFFPIFAKKNSVSDSFDLIKKRLFLSHIITLFLGIFLYYLIPVIGKMILPEDYYISLDYAAILVFFVVNFEFQSTTLKNILESQAKIESRFVSLLFLSIVRIITMVICSYIGGVRLLVLGKGLLYILSLIVWYFSVFIEMRRERSCLVSDSG